MIHSIACPPRQTVILGGKQTVSQKVDPPSSIGAGQRLTPIHSNFCELVLSSTNQEGKSPNNQTPSLSGFTQIAHL